MTGPALGKLRVGAKVAIVSELGESKVNGEVYIHLKGYALARVTHLDIEHEALGRFIKPRTGRFLLVKGMHGGIEIDFSEEGLFHGGGRLMAVRVYSGALNRVLKPGRTTRTWVGGKFGGIYIGFRKNEVRKLEEVARESFGMEPR